MRTQSRFPSAYFAPRPHKSTMRKLVRCRIIFYSHYFYCYFHVFRIHTHYTDFTVIFINARRRVLWNAVPLPRRTLNRIIRPGWSCARHRQLFRTLIIITSVGDCAIIIIIYILYLFHVDDDIRNYACSIYSDAD